MKKIIRLLIVVSLLLPFSYCTSPLEEDGTVDTSSEIDSLFSAIGKLESPPTSSEVVLSRKSGVPINDGGTFVCNQDEIRLTQRLESFYTSAFDIANPNLATLYPGAIVTLDDLGGQNILTSIGNIGRTDISIRSSSLGMQANVQPGQASQAIDEMENSFSGDVPANFIYNSTEAYSTDQALLKLGISVSWLGNSVSNKFSVSNSASTRTVMVSFIQSYHTVSMDYPGRASAFFSSNVTADDLAARMSSGSPLGYISQVTYGRMIIAKITYDARSNQTSNQLAAGLRTGLVGINFNFDTDTKSTLEKSSIELSVLGGSSSIISQLNTGTNAFDVLSNIQSYLAQDANNLQVGLPIAYTVRYLLDNSLFSVGGTTEYTAQECLINPERAFIESLTVEQFPLVNPSDGGDWDSFFNGFKPDIYFELWEETSTGGFQLIYENRNSRAENAGSDDLPITFDFANPFELGNWKERIYTIDLIDYDVAPPSDLMGVVFLDLPELLPNSGEYPTEIVLNDADQNVRIRLALRWE